MLRFTTSLSPVRVWAIAALPLLGMTLLALHVPSSRAAQPLDRPAFVVNNVADATDANLDDPACATADGACTLRAAVQQANALPGADSISVPPGLYTLTLTGTDDLAAAGDLDITDDLTIAGALTDTTIIDMGKRDRVFDVYTATVTLANLVMQNGYARTQGGGIYNRGVLTLTASSVDGSSASSGGAIWNSGTLAVDNTTLSANRASGAGGAVANNGTLQMVLSTLRGNAAAAGGALYQAKGALTVQRSTVEGNAASYGGGIAVDPDGAVIIDASTLSSNRASQAGGGVYNYGSMQLITSTLSGNQTDPAIGFSGIATGGGGIWNRGDMTVLNATLVNNAAASGSAVQNSGTITFTNSIVASNDSEIGGVNCIGTIVSGGHNLENGTTCGFNRLTDLLNMSPALGELRSNGGATRTHALMEDGPAIDSGANVGCPGTDQRGVTRPQGPRCDIGAFELEQAVVPIATLTATLAPVTTSISESPTATPTPPTSVPTETPTATAVLSSPLPTETPPLAPAPSETQRVLLPLVMK